VSVMTPPGQPRGLAAAEHLSPAFPERAARGTVQPLRAWQEEALQRYWEADSEDFLVAATPGAGKTTFALRLAAQLRARGIVQQIIVVAPTEHLKRQWADAAARVSIRLDPRFQNANNAISRHYHGAAVTYAQVAVAAELHRRITDRVPTLVILDEVHHGGDALSWGDAIRIAYSGATRRLLLSGTPFRSDEATIPFVHYEREADGSMVSRSDYRYGYGRALQDGVVRPVLFHSYGGTARWRDRFGEEMSAKLGDPDTADVSAQAWRTALDPEGEWLPSVLRAADRRLSEVRAEVPDAGGLVIATDQRTARAYAKILQGITGQAPTVVLSDDPSASGRIEQFSKSNDRWMVAVRMVSEGVDVPRLCVGVYATNASTPLYFAQVIGRFVRARRRGEAASVFLPTVPVLHELAAELERERDHALGRKDGAGDEDGLLDDLDAANREDRASEDLTEPFEFTALESEAAFSGMLYRGDAFGLPAAVGSVEEEEYLGLPGILSPDQVKDLLSARQERQRRKAAAEARRRAAARQAAILAGGSKADPDLAASTVPANPDQPLYRTLQEQRQLLNSLVAIYARRMNQPHSHVHAEARRRCGGPPVNRASVAQLQARIDLLRKWVGY